MTATAISFEPSTITIGAQVDLPAAGGDTCWTDLEAAYLGGPPH